MNLPKISIVIPSYNQGQYLEETLLSVIDQQYPNLELFVVDGGSNDNSVEIIKRYEQYLTWWVSEKDSGQSEAINKGFQKATGEIISWLCSDDLLTSDSLNTVAAHFSKVSGSIGLIHGGAIVFEQDKKETIIFNYQTPCKEAYLAGMVFPQPAAFFRKSCLDQVGLLNETLHYGMDHELFQRLSLVCEFLPINGVLAKYRLHGQSKSVAENTGFIDDWKASFINVCKNLQWTEEVDYLNNTGLFGKQIDYFQPYSFVPSIDLLATVNKKKALFFHLGHVLKELYWNHEIKEAKRLKKIMKNDFGIGWWQDDPRLKIISNKLHYTGFPVNLIRALRKHRN